MIIFCRKSSRRYQWPTSVQVWDYICLQYWLFLVCVYIQIYIDCQSVNISDGQCIYSQSHISFTILLWSAVKCICNVMSYVCYNMSNGIKRLSTMIHCLLFASTTSSPSTPTLEDFWGSTSINVHILGKSDLVTKCVRG